MTDETIIFQTKLNWTEYVKGLVVLLLGLLIDPFWILLISIGLIILVMTYLNVRLSNFTVTNKRILINDAFFIAQSRNIILSEIEGVHVEQGIIGKLLNFGSIVVRVVGGTQYFYFNVNKPDEFRKAINEHLSKGEKKLCRYSR